MWYYFGLSSISHHLHLVSGGILGASWWIIKPPLLSYRSVIVPNFYTKEDGWSSWDTLHSKRSESPQKVESASNLPVKSITVVASVWFIGHLIILVVIWVHYHSFSSMDINWCLCGGSPPEEIHHQLLNFYCINRKMVPVVRPHSILCPFYVIRLSMIVIRYFLDNNLGSW